MAPLLAHARRIRAGAGARRRACTGSAGFPGGAWPQRTTVTLPAAGLARMLPYYAQDAGAGVHRLPSANRAW
jgi:hypothetical protein